MDLLRQHHEPTDAATAVFASRATRRFGLWHRCCVRLSIGVVVSVFVFVYLFASFCSLAGGFLPDLYFSLAVPHWRHRHARSYVCANSCGGAGYHTESVV